MKNFFLIGIFIILSNCASVTTTHLNYEKLDRSKDTHWAQVYTVSYNATDVVLDISTLGVAAQKNFTITEYSNSKQAALTEAHKSCKRLLKEKNYTNVECRTKRTGAVAKTQEQIRNEKIAAEKKKEEEEFQAMVNKAKNQCKLFGYEEKSNEMRDCVLKLYTQEMDNKIALETARMQKEVAERNARAKIRFTTTK